MRRPPKPLIALVAVLAMLAVGIPSAQAAEAPSGATVTIDGRDTGLNPSDGYDPNPDDSDISGMKVIDTGAGRTEIHDLPAGWHVNAEQWDWKGRSGIRYHIYKGSANYNWFFAGATSFKHSVYELRSIDYYKTIDESPITGYDWSRNQTVHGFVDSSQIGYHFVNGWTGVLNDGFSDRFEYKWTADDDPNLTITHDFMYDTEAPADWSKLMAYLPDGSPVTGFDPDGVSNKIPTDTKTVTWDGIPSGWTISDSYATKDRIITHFSKTGQHDKTVILYWTDDYEYSYTADQLKKLTATTDTGEPVTGFDPANGGSFALPAGATGVTLAGAPDGWTLDGPDYDGTSITWQVSSPDSKIVRRYTFIFPDHTPTLDDLRDLTPTTDGGKPIDGFDPTRSGTWQVPEDATIGWTGIPRNGWTWSHAEGTLSWTIRSVDGAYSFTYTFIPTHEPARDDLSGVTAVTDTGETVDGFAPVNGGTFPVPAGTTRVDLKDIPDGWTATPMPAGLGYTLTSSNGLTVTYIFDVQPYTQMTADELAALARYRWKSKDGTLVQATPDDTDTVDGTPADWTLEWTGTGTSPLTEDPDAGWHDAQGGKTDATSPDAVEYRMTVTGPVSGITATLRLHTSLKNQPVYRNVGFDMKGGRPILRTVRVIDGKPVTKPGDPVRDGYRFAGWLLDGRPYDFSQPVTRNITLTASWTSIGSHAIVFDSAGGTFIPAQTIPDGQTGAEPDAPARTGYTFDGWLLDGRPYDWDTPVTSDITLTASWTANMMSVTFDPGDDGTVSAVSVAYGNPVDRPADPVRDGYRFDGWLLDGEPYDFTAPVTRDLTLDASWTRLTHTVAFDTAGGTPIGPIAVDDGKPVLEPADPTRDGYEFSGWLLDGRPYDFDTPVTRDITLTALWDETPAVTHLVTFDTAGGGRVDPQAVTDGQTATKPRDPTRAGYEFKGWLLDGKPYDFTSPVTGDITLTAVWTPIPVTHAVTFDRADGTDPTVITVEDGNPAVRPEDPVRDGYVFLGWTLDGRAYDFSAPVTGDLTLTAEWEKTKPATHVVRFDTAGGTAVPAQTVTDGSKAIKPADPTRKGYKFAGWTFDGQPYDFTTPVTADLTITAEWVPLPVERTVLFDTGDGSKPTSTTVKDGTTVDRPKDPIRKGWTFDGWLLDGKAYDFTQPVTGDITLTGSWTRITHAIRFDTAGGTPVAGQSVADGEPAVRPADPTREGYAFKDWLLDGKPYDFTLQVTRDLTLTAEWEKTKPATHTVTFDTGDGSKPATITAEDGKPITKPKDPVRDGHTFRGWLLDGRPYDFTLPVTKDLTLTAEWEKAKPAIHTIRFDHADGAVDTAAVEDGKPVAKPADPIRKGWTFKGWLLDGQPYDFALPATRNLTLTASWTRITHTVRFDTAGGTTIPRLIVPDGDAIGRVTDPVREGCRFAGWTLDGKPYDPATPVTRDLTLVAGWERTKPATHTVAFDTADGRTPATAAVEDGKPAARPKDPTRDGYRFAGWYNGDTPYDFARPVTGNLTLTARWERDTPATRTVLFDHADGSKPDRIPVEDGKPVGRPADPIRKGWTFDGWLLDGKTYDFARPVTSDITLTASWTKIPVTHTVAFDAGNGSKTDIRTVRDGTPVARPKDPTHKGWTFMGWTLDGRPYDFATPVTRDITLVADWAKDAARTHTVTWDYAHDGLTGVTTITDGQPVPEPAKPARPGYEFAGWRLDGRAYDFTAPVTRDLTLVAAWRDATPATHTVSFDTTGGSPVGPVTVRDGNTIAKPAAPTRDGHEFAGWLLDGRPYDFTTPVTRDLTLTASWRKSGTDKPIYGIADLRDLGFDVDGKPYQPFKPGTREYRLPDGKHTVGFTAGTVPAGWKAIGGVIRRPDGYERREYTLTSPDGKYTAGYAFEWNTKTPAYTKDDLRHVTAGTDGKRVDGFDPTRDGTYRVPDGSRVTIGNLPAGWKVKEAHSPDGMILTYTVSSPDSRITVIWRFESDKAATPGTGRGDGDPADPDTETPKGITGIMEAGLPDTGVGLPSPWFILAPALAGLALILLRRHGRRA